MILGFVTAYWFYILNPSIPGRLAASQRPLYNFLLNKWYFDEIYDASSCALRSGWAALPVEGRRRVGHRRRDQRAGDGDHPVLHPHAQPGAVRLHLHYAFAMVLGIVVLITWATLSAGG
jgi:NADH-quinone oxidoreductase subunit L